MTSPSDIPLPMVDLHVHRAVQALAAINKGIDKNWSERRTIRRAKRVLQTTPPIGTFVSI